MTNLGGLPARRPDQHEAQTPRGTAPGSRAVQVTNSKTNALTVRIINDPGEPVIVQDGGVLDCLSVQAYANDNTSVQLLPATLGGSYQLWYLTISSLIATASGSGVVQVDDVVALAGGKVLGAVVNGLAGAEGSSVVAAEFDLKGVIISAEQVNLISGDTGYTHRVSAVLQYSIPS